MASLFRNEDGSFSLQFTAADGARPTIRVGKTKREANEIKGRVEALIASKLSGGDSLAALQLFAKIEKLCGKKLPLTSLMHAKTVRQFARLVGWERTSSLWPSLVQVQSGTSRHPLFCMHPIGGNIFGYYGLARYLGSDQRVYALRARGLDGIQQPHETIEEMARDYLAEVRQVQRHGPYYLCGHSFGGLVAYEMARQLHSQGEKTALLAIFDSRKPAVLPSPLAYGGQLLARLQLRTFVGKGWRRLNWWAWRAKVHLAEAFYKLMRWPLPRELAHIRASDYCTRAAHRYEPRAYPGRLTFFRAVPATALPAVPTAAARAKIDWDELAIGGMENHVVPCEHSSMLTEPHVQVLAEQLRVCLEKARDLVPHQCESLKR
jgi:aspartate racemase